MDMLKRRALERHLSNAPDQVRQTGHEGEA